MRIPEEILSQWEISGADKAALADLPETVEPFFHADPQSEGQPMMRGGFYRVGNDLGMDIGVGAQGSSLSTGKGKYLTASSTRASPSSPSSSGRQARSRPVSPA